MENSEIAEKQKPTNLGQLIEDRQSAYNTKLLEAQGSSANWETAAELVFISKQIYSLNATRDEVMQERGSALGKGDVGTIDTTTEYGLQNIADNTSISVLHKRYINQVTEWEKDFESVYAGKVLDNGEIMEAADALEGIRVGKSLIELTSGN